MIKTRASIIAAIFAIVLSGCSSMDVGTNSALRNSELVEGAGNPMEHVLISNYGWYLFNCIPLVCGNATPDASFPWKFFSNHVDPMMLHGQLTRYAESRNADVKDLVFTRNEKVFFDIPGSEFQIPVPFLLCLKEAQFSAVLVERKAAGGPVRRDNADGRGSK